MVARFAVIALWCACLVVGGCGGKTQNPALIPKSMPSGGSFSGVWFSPQYGEMHIVQNGSNAIGRYEKEERRGRIQGTVEGDVMRFEWTEKREIIKGRPMETKGHGYFRIEKNEAEDTFNITGEWGNDQAETGGGPWTAIRSKKMEPDVDGEGGGGSGDDSSDSDSSDSDSGEEESSGGSDELGDL
jgi:hypothetical protein